VQDLLQAALAAHAEACRHTAAAAAAAEQLWSAAAAAAGLQLETPQGPPAQSAAVLGVICSTEAVAEAPAPSEPLVQQAAEDAGVGAGAEPALPPQLAELQEVVNAVCDLHQHFMNAAWGGLDSSVVPLAQDLRMVASASVGLVCELSSLEKVCASSQASFLGDRWEQGVNKALEQASKSEMTAGRSAALAYHALSACGH
jgi:hypothetical protein